jgi:hypothetical protein
VRKGGALPRQRRIAPYSRRLRLVSSFPQRRDLREEPREVLFPLRETVVGCDESGEDLAAGIELLYIGRRRDAASALG